MKTVVIDARMYGLEHAGIGRYVLNLVKEIGQLEEKRLRFSLIVSQKKLGPIKEELGEGFDYFPANSSHYSFNEQFEIPLILKKIKPDLIHFPHFNASLFWSGNFVVTIHDLIKHYFKGKKTTTRTPFFYWAKYLGYRLQINHSLKKSKLIFTPSDFWKEKLTQDFNLAPEKIIVTHEAVESKFLKLAQNKKGEILKKMPFFIYTGSVYPHKNLEILLKALKKISQVKLLIVSSRNVFTQRLNQTVKKFGLEKRVVFLGFVEDEKLIGLYQRAAALVQPSLMEGFGLTGLEAMAAGCPVLSSKSSCLPEIYGRAALYFNPLEVNDLEEKLRRILKSKKLRRKLIKKGKKQVEKYSWKKTAQETIEGYKKVLGL